MMRVLPASWSSSSASSSGAKEQVEEPSSNRTVVSSSSSAVAAAVYLNIYDISPLNHYLYWFGLGIFHSGIEVHGMEYGFGAHEYPTSGVFEVEPKSCPGFIFRRSVCLGSTDMSRLQVRTAIEDLAEDYHGDTYHLIIKNCNHFTADVCKSLTGKVLSLIAYCLKASRFPQSEMQLHTMIFLMMVRVPMHQLSMEVTRMI